MKSIINYLSEAKFANSNNRYGTPDFFKHNDKYYEYTENEARPFIYNKQLKKVLWGKPGESHYDMIDMLTKTEKDNFGLINVTDTNDLRWDWFEEYDTKKDIDNAIKQWNKEHPVANNFLLGRVWHSKNEDTWDNFIVWWNELTKLQFTRLCNFIINDYNKKNITEEDELISDYYAIDNNGEFIEMNVNDNITRNITPRNKKYQEVIKKMRAIHLATQEEKRKYFELYRKHRDEYFQKLYNKTKSGTEAEWHNNKVKRYNPITGKMEWGEKIGDSLEIKSIRNYILEKEID